MTDDVISKAVSAVLCEAPDCGDVATWRVDGKNGETCVLCGAHEAILALSPGERERFDELCAAWARESARE